MKSEALQFRMTPRLIEQVDQWAERLGGTRSDAARDLIRIGLENMKLWPPPPADEKAA